ncbi:Uncharacterised protein [Legionella wadsworthii]|uniref:Coiled coil protein n=1 Tax=Legionella wadsworthii TaxID=28088 RepID=A0A378LV25_9GAMM|nr:hypothetical protein [Legionella wadsworthii]STY27951.1 Uncharacterised protein [Legionella wadsworthii]
MRTQLEIELQSKIDRSQELIEILQNTIAELLSLQTEGEKQHKELQDKIDTLIKKQAALEARVIQAETKYKHLQEDWEKKNDVYKQQLEQQERLLDQLDEIDSFKTQTTKGLSVSQSLKRNGIYANLNKVYEMFEENQDPLIQDCHTRMTEPTTGTKRP